MGFKSANIVAPRDDRPHIVLREGRWRVSMMDHARFANHPAYSIRWTKAHFFMGRLNRIRDSK